MTRRAVSNGDEPPPPEALLSPEELATYLAVPLATVYRWRNRGEGPVGYRVGRHVRYKLEDVEAWLEPRRDTPESLTLASGNGPAKSPARGRKTQRANENERTTKPQVSGHLVAFSQADDGC